MALINFDQLFGSLKTNVTALAEQSIKDEVTAAKADGLTLLDTAKNSISIWSQQLADGDISGNDFTYLVQSQYECSEMVALKNAGLAEVRIDEFKNGIITCIIDTVSKFL